MRAAVSELTPHQIKNRVQKHPQIAACPQNWIDFQNEWKWIRYIFRLQPRTPLLKNLPYLCQVHWSNSFIVLCVAVWMLVEIRIERGGTRAGGGAWGCWFVLPRNSPPPHADRKCYTTGRIRQKMSGNITVQSLPKRSSSSTLGCRNCAFHVLHVPHGNYKMFFCGGGDCSSSWISNTRPNCLCLYPLKFYLTILFHGSSRISSFSRTLFHSFLWVWFSFILF